MHELERIGMHPLGTSLVFQAQLMGGGRIKSIAVTHPCIDLCTRKPHWGHNTKFTKGTTFFFHIKHIFILPVVPQVL